MDGHRPWFKRNTVELNNRIPKIKTTFGWIFEANYLYISQKFKSNVPKAFILNRYAPTLFL